jgi:DNA-binding SARP family transcriptional activator
VLLAMAPAPPAQSCYLAVLGPQALNRGQVDGDPVVDHDLRRRRVQELIAFLVMHRQTTRSAIAAAIWPYLDERSAANNLGVTLNHLMRLLEPTRHSGEPGYLLRYAASRSRTENVTGRARAQVPQRDWPKR